MNNYISLTPEELKGWFIRFAENECKETAPLYNNLCKEIAGDEELLAIAAHTSVGQPMPNIFLGAIHFLLLQNPEEPLAKYYPTITKINITGFINFDLFKEFCVSNKERIQKLVSTKIVQTNVVNRCSYLFPIISELIESDDKPLTIVDIGTSAGLTLSFDDYEYWYNQKKAYGNSDVVIHTEIRGECFKYPKALNNKITKIGIDQNPIQAKDHHEQLWLKALIWPDHLMRFQIMDMALRNEKLADVQFIVAHSNSDFENILSFIPSNEQLIIYATHTLYQFSPEAKIEFYEMLDRLSVVRDFSFISAEATRSQQEKYQTKNVVVELIQYINGMKAEKWIAETDGHGNWVRFL